MTYQLGIVLDTGGDLTGNKTVDALLYQKRKQAEEEKIKWECDVQMPKDCCINELDKPVSFQIHKIPPLP